jgi:transcriptional regulator with XRE-family HTH domain
MNDRKTRISPAQCRAGRALVGWSQTILADRANMSRKTVADLELMRRVLSRRSALAIRDALESAGVHFADQDGVSIGKSTPAPIAPTFAPPP